MGNTMEVSRSMILCPRLPEQKGTSILTSVGRRPSWEAWLWWGLTKLERVGATELGTLTWLGRKKSGCERG